MDPKNNRGVFLRLRDIAKNIRIAWIYKSER